MMNLQEIAIKKLKCLYTPTVSTYTVDTNKVLMLQTEAMRLGFRFTDEAVAFLSNNKEEYENVFSILSELVGANKTWKPFYSNFPEVVYEMSEIELYENARKHYDSDGTWRPDETSSKFPVFENVDFKTIGLCGENEITRLFRNILESNGSITEYDKKIVNYSLLKRDNAWFKDVKITFKETLCEVVGLLYKNGLTSLEIPSVKTATDILRIASYFSAGDITLAEKTRFKLKNAQRRYIVQLLEKVITEEEIAKYKDEWVALFHHLHIGSFKKATSSNLIAKKLREEKVRSMNSPLEIALEKRDEKALLELLPRNMGDFARRLDFILREFEDNTKFLSLFYKGIKKVDTRVLLQVLSHFTYRNERDIRVVIPKGNPRKSHILKDAVKIVPDKSIDLLVTMLRGELIMRYSVKPKLGKTWINDSLKKAPIPMQMRTASDGLYVMQRGTRMKLNEKSIVRFFIHWTGDDVDLSACFLTENLSYHSTIAYYNQKSDVDEIRSVHSGDITRAPNGACEFIDIDMDSIKDKSIRYVVLDVRVYSGGSLVDQQANAGWMMRSELGSHGEIFDAKTVEQRILLSTNKNAVVALFDLKEREVIWMDLEGSSSTLNGGNNVASNKPSMKQMAEIAINFKNLSIYDLLKLHAVGRGELVSDKESADTVFDNDYIFKHSELLGEFV